MGHDYVLMSYAIEILEKEIRILSKCLSDWESKEYPLAKTEREKRLSDLNKALEVIQSK